MADSDKQQARNRLVVWVFAAACAGFIVAMYLGAFFAANATTEMKEVPAWASTLISGFAALVSAYAVYLVAATLKATRDTLDATRIMAEDQRQMSKEQARIGDAQVRPWLCMKSYKLEEVTFLWGEKGDVLEVTIQNYGNTPARNIVATFGMITTNLLKDIDGNYIRGENGRISHADPIRNEYEIVRRSTLAPGQSNNFRMSVYDHMEGDSNKTAFITFNYEDMNGSIKEDQTTEVQFQLCWDEDYMYIGTVT